MNIIEEWAEMYGIPQEMIDELRAMMGHVLTAPPVAIATNRGETAVATDVRLEAAMVNCRLFRNNVGACQDKTGRWIRYGLCNESKAMNKVIKSHDFIGIIPILIKPEHVGTIIGQFIARETKKPGWVFNPKEERDVAQQAFGDLINSLGGDARFASGPGSFKGF